MKRNLLVFAILSIFCFGCHSDNVQYTWNLCGNNTINYNSNSFVIDGYENFFDGLDCAKEQNKPVLVFFYGYGAISIKGLENKIFEDIIAELIIDILAEKEIESIKMLALIEDKENQHPYIKNVPIFNLFKINFQIYYVSDLFGDNDAELAQVQLNKLNDMLDALNTEEPEWLPEELAFMYGHISSYHYRMANFSLALEWVNKGLDLQPESTSLLNKKSYIFF